MRTLARLRLLLGLLLMLVGIGIMLSCPFTTHPDTRAFVGGWTTLIGGALYFASQPRGTRT